MLDELLSVIKMKNYAIIFTAVFLAVSVIYGYLLINSATGVIDFRGYYMYFDIAFSIVIALLISSVIMLNVYSFRMKAKSGRGISIASIASAVLPSSLCCTSLVPSILAVAGFSTSFVLGNTGKIQSIFSIYGPLFIVFGAGLAWLGLMQITRNIKSGCNIAESTADDECCRVDDENKN